MIFPKNKITGNYIQLVRLRPRISEDIIGEELKLTCKMSISNAGNDYMFNSVFETDRKPTLLSVFKILVDINKKS